MAVSEWFVSWNNCLVTERLHTMFSAKNFKHFYCQQNGNGAAVYLVTGPTGSRPTTSDCSTDVTMTGLDLAWPSLKPVRSFSKCQTFDFAFTFDDVYQ